MTFIIISFKFLLVVLLAVCIFVFWTGVESFLHRSDPELKWKAMHRF